MKITKIEENQFNIYTVTFEPNLIERLLNIKSYKRKYKDTGNHYALGGGSVYIDQKGRKLGNGNWIGNKIDEWKRKF